MTADPQPTLPDPRTANDDERPEGEPAANEGRSATTPVEGADDAPTEGSPG
ncbi:hypothetical protein [Sphingomonas sp.]|uniref:hypothetical protein n=1 Tax=Sphingomonas sp. TaxID=28214 RepID=UPI002D80DB70|nr:hypothetical protein [Sphingomonas sp.]HEU0043541.1 hypothetical protein [Sphingomonas sp.]